LISKYICKTLQNSLGNLWLFERRDEMNTNTENPIDTAKTATATSGQDHQYSSIADYILGITFQIWEQRQIDSIHHYYSDDVHVFSLDGFIHGAEKMVSNTRKTLATYPDRLLLGDAVIATGNLQNGFSSHRIISPMTNTGPSAFGPATNRRVQNMNIADCVIKDGQITREWLVRDNLALIKQLGFDPINAAQFTADKFDDTQIQWLNKQFARTIESQQTATTDHEHPLSEFAFRVLEACWATGNKSTLEQAYAPYAVLNRAPQHTHSGAEQISAHFAGWRNALPNASISVDHICSQPYGHSGELVAIRWSVAAEHKAAFSGCEASGKPIYILGVTHWRIIDKKIVAEWTVFDELAVMAQTRL
jgi:predicted ester cyclase